MKRSELKRGKPPQRKTELRRGKPLVSPGFKSRKKKKNPKPRTAKPKYKRNWTKMSSDAEQNAGGLCERCPKSAPTRLPTGTPPAHLIERDIKKPELDEAWNLAWMGFVQCDCHTDFDKHRGEIAYKALILKDPAEAWLVRRIEAEDDTGRLRTYFERRAAIWASKLEMEKAVEENRTC